MNRPPYPSLTAVVHGMVKAAPSGLDARTVADLVGKPYATLMSELSQQPGHKLGAELLLPLMDVCESDLPPDPGLAGKAAGGAGKDHPVAG